MSGLRLPFKGTMNFTRKQFCFKINFIPVDAVSSWPNWNMEWCSAAAMEHWLWSSVVITLKVRMERRKTNKEWGKVHHMVSQAHTRMLWLGFHEISVSHCPSPHNCPSSHPLTRFCCCIFRGHRTCVCLGGHNGVAPTRCIVWQGKGCTQDVSAKVFSAGLSQLGSS